MIKTKTRDTGPETSERIESALSSKLNRGGINPQKLLGPVKNHGQHHFRSRGLTHMRHSLAFDICSLRRFQSIELLHPSQRTRRMGHPWTSLHPAQHLVYLIGL